MFKNYVKTAFRSVLKNKGFSIINILGLGIGIASFVLISLYVYHAALSNPTQALRNE